MDSETLKRLLRDLECPVCLQVPTEAPIYQCNNGHTHCKNCHPSLKECPLCRSKQFNFRATTTENIILTLPKSCQFVENGCPFKAEQNLLATHEQNCNFKIVNCQKCGRQTLQFDLPRHEVNCQVQPIKCKYSHMGCKEQVFWNQSIQQHEINCQYEPQSCRWRTNGCRIELPLMQIMEHQVECKFAPIQCLYCHQNITVFDFTSHFTEVHAKTIHQDKATYYVPKEAPYNNLPSVHLQFKSHHFVAYNNHDTGNPFAYAWIDILGSRKDVDKFYGSIKIFNKQNVSFIKDSWVTKDSFLI